MSTDGHNFDTPTNPSDDTQPQATVGAVNDVAHTQSRRNFLRTAVISGVAVATVGTTAGVAAAAAQPHTGVLTRLGIANPFCAVSGSHNCTLCFEDTDYNKLTSFNVDKHGHNSPGQFYLWFVAQNLPQGTYTMKITLDPGNHTMVHSPFAYPPGGGNYAQLYQLSANSSSNNGCPTGKPQTTAAEGSKISDCFPYATTGTGNVDLWLAVHLAWDGTKITEDKTYYFKGTLMDKDGHTVCTTPTLQVDAKYVPNGNY